MVSSSFDLTTTIHRAYKASQDLVLIPSQNRNQALLMLADMLKNSQNAILEANTLDLETSREMAVPEIIISWLKLTPERLQNAVRILQQIANLPDPLDRTVIGAYQTGQYQAYCQPVPLGVILLIYEALPELAMIAAGMSLKTGNSLLLRGGSEATQTNSIMAELLHNAALDANLPQGCWEPLSLSQGTPLKDLLAQDQYIDLILPYGRPSLVQQVVRQTSVPVLRPGMANCYLFWSASGNGEMTRSIILDSYQGSPDPVNAIEKVLLHANLNRSLLLVLWNSLREKGFELRGDEDLVAEFPDLKLVDPKEWSQPYLKRIIAFKVVDDLEAAIAWINTHSSCHADCLVTESYRESRQFALGVDSALTFINTSPRYTRYSGTLNNNVSLGISNQKGHRRGYIGLESLMTTKCIVQGDGKIPKI